MRQSLSNTSIAPTFYEVHSLLEPIGVPITVVQDVGPQGDARGEDAAPVDRVHCVQHHLGCLYGSLSLISSTTAEVYLLISKTTVLSQTLTCQMKHTARK